MNSLITWKVLLAAVLLVSLAIVITSSGRKALGLAARLFVGWILWPLRGATTNRFRRFQREKILKRDSLKSGLNDSFDYIRYRRNILPRGTIDLWLPDTVSPSTIRELREQLGWFFHADEEWIQDIQPVGRHRRLRLFGRSYFPDLSTFKIDERRLRRLLKKHDQSVYLGTSAVAKDVIFSLRDKILFIIVGRPGSGKSLQGMWIIESLLLQDISDITVFGSVVDYGYLNRRCRILTGLSELVESLSNFEREAESRIETMIQASTAHKTRVADSTTFERLTGKKMSLKVLMIDEMQEIMSKRLTGSKEEVELKKAVQEKVNAVISKYRKVNMTVVLLGTVSQGSELALNMSAASYKSAGYLGHVETSRSFLDGSPLANNSSLDRGRMVVICADLSTSPFILQVPVGFRIPRK